MPPERPFHANVGELTTPTGAALITTLADEFRQPAMTLDRIGVGIGGKNPLAFPNVLRLWVGELAGADRRADPSGQPVPPVARWQDNVILLETNLDDATGEQLGFAMERLFEAGALDVWYTPIQMKKNRPGILLSALGPAALENKLAEVFLRDTPTLGVRVRPVGRYVAERGRRYSGDGVRPHACEAQVAGRRGGQRGAGIRGRGGSSPGVSDRVSGGCPKYRSEYEPGLVVRLSCQASIGPISVIPAFAGMTG